MHIFRPFQKGFSLIELMIVVAIIGILVGSAMPNFMELLEDSKYSKAKQDIDIIKNQCILFHTKESRFPNKTDELLGKYMVKIPLSPWGSEYKIDEFFIVAETPNGELKTPFYNPGLIGFLRDGDLFTRDFISGSSMKLLSLNGQVKCFSWHPDGSRIYYNSSGIIYSINVNATPEKRVEEFDKADDIAISPNGTYMTYDWANDLYIKTLNSKERPSAPLVRNARTSSWAGNSNGLVFVMEGCVSVVRINNGRVIGKIMKGPSGENPKWCSINTKILFLRGRNLIVTSAGKIKSNGSSAEKEVIAENVLSADWIPRSNKIVYTASDGNAYQINLKNEDAEPQLIFMDAKNVQCCAM